MAILVWPHQLLVPVKSEANVVPFSRSGGRSLGGLEPTTRTDRGFWSIRLNDIILENRRKRRAWTALQTELSGRAGLIAVPVWSFDTAPYPEGVDRFHRSIPHSDGTYFSDGAGYQGQKISLRAPDAVPIGATSMRLQVINAEADLVGIRFSYQHAAYQTGFAGTVEGAFWTVSISPAIRAPIPAGASLEVDMPTCLCRLKDDSGMDTDLDVLGMSRPSVGFNEATDYWDDLAAGLI